MRTKWRSGSRSKMQLGNNKMKTMILQKPTLKKCLRLKEMTSKSKEMVIWSSWRPSLQLSRKDLERRVLSQLRLTLQLTLSSSSWWITWRIDSKWDQISLKESRPNHCQTRRSQIDQRHSFKPMRIPSLTSNPSLEDTVQFHHLAQSRQETMPFFTEREFTIFLMLMSKKTSWCSHPNTLRE